MSAIDRLLYVCIPMICGFLYVWYVLLQKWSRFNCCF